MYIFKSYNTSISYKTFTSDKKIPYRIGFNRNDNQQLELLLVLNITYLVDPLERLGTSCQNKIVSYI